MKKLLLVATATAALASSALASDYYIHGDVGGAMNQKFTEKASGLKLKRKTTPFVSLGVGMQAMDQVRAEFAIGHHFDPSYSKSANDKSAKAKLKITSFGLRGFVDFADLDYAKFYAGVGANLARVKSSVTATQAGISEKASSKTANNFGFEGMLGADFPVADGVLAGVKYTYASYGKPKSFKFKDDDTKYRLGNISYHMLTAGIKVAI